ncbi:hypothetical protein SPI_02370 [Niveomyces insectorum RCEF 264]|uniref:Uncharacterized protein n=1 Tax=Niveomyces insectorum RCEF 264 TaxID=1081102 RepID=A0A167XYI2_9HYPO|nr:hypothetical protein SPI_02370 [Niveomyces insectorum RCEF 264]
MNGAPETAVKTHTTHRPRKRVSPQELRRRRLRYAVDRVWGRLVHLARLGRAGQWVLHQYDIYKPGLDTQPDARDPDKEVPIRGLTTTDGFPVDDCGLIWAGKGPVPDFQDASFWEGKCKELDAKIKEVKAKRVHHCFTPERLRVLESLEQQEDHYFNTVVVEKRQKAEGCHNLVFHSLFELAGLGRPGQWILHNEDLYHPAIDTRPQTRRAEKSIVIHDSVFHGNEKFWYKDGEIPVRFELFWEGEGPQPDFGDSDYWLDKAEDFSGMNNSKYALVKKGLIQPNFTPEELRVLESLEAQDGHLFAEVVRRRRENPNPPVQKTPESRAAAKKLLETKLIVQSLLCHLWDCGLAGKWVLHNSELYVPDYDIGDRHKDEEDPQRHTILKGKSEGLYYYGTSDRAMLPDFDNIEYWEETLADLQTKRREVEAGTVEHHFTPGELIRIQLLEQEEDNALALGSSEAQKENGINAWINNTKEEQPLPPLHPLPSPPSRSRSASLVSSEPAGRGFSSPCGTDGFTGSEHSQVRRDLGTKKRKRSTNIDEDVPPGDTTARSAKRSKSQPRPGPLVAPGRTSRHNLSASLQEVQGPQRIPTTSGLLPSGPLNVRRTTGHLSGKRDTHRTTTKSNTMRERNAVEKGQLRRQRAAGPRAGGHGQRKTRRSLIESSPSELRRSERLVGLPRKDYTWKGLCT